MRSCFSYFLYVFTCVVIVVFVTNEIKEKKKKKKKVYTRLTCITSKVYFTFKASQFLHHRKSPSSQSEDTGKNG